MRAAIAALFTALLALVLAPVAVAEPVVDAPDGETGGAVTIALLDVATDLADDPRANTYITDHVPPGETITHQVRVTNDTDADTVLDVYAGPATVDSGAFTVGNAGEISVLTSWIEIDRTVLELGPGESADVTVTIAVPADAPETEHYGVIWASTTGDDEAGSEVEVLSRVGVRIYLSVGEGNGPPSGFTVDELTPSRDAEGNAVVTAAVHNTGGRAVDVSGSLDLTGGPGGLSAETVSAQTLTIGPDQRGEVVFIVPDSAALPAGPWQAAMELSSGYLTEEAAAELTFPDEGSGTAVSADDEDGLSTGAWVGIAVAIVVVLIIAAVAALALVRRRAAGSDAPRHRS